MQPNIKEPMECVACSSLVEWIEAGGREYAFDMDGELHKCWQQLPDGADLLTL